MNATIDSKMTEGLNLIESQLEHTLMINGTDYAKELVTEFDHFKEAIVKKIQETVAEAAAGAKAKGIPLSQEEVMKLMDALHDELDLVIKVQVKDWSEKELKEWAGKAQKAWLNVEAPVVDNIRRLLDFLDRHTPGRGASE